MTAVPGTSPGLPSSVSAVDSECRAYARPWLAVAVASVGFAVTAALISAYPAMRVQIAGSAAWLVSVIDLLVVCVPLVATVLVAAVVASKVGFARATGVRTWRVSDVLLGVAVALVVRAVAELLAPTTGSLAGPLAGALSADQVAAITVAVVGIVLVSPVIEELFFRGLVLRAFVDVLSATTRLLAAGLAVVVSTAAFVALHLVSAGGVISVELLVGAVGVGLSCGILAVVTGRLGASIVAHILFNASGVALLLL